MAGNKEMDIVYTIVDEAPEVRVWVLLSYHAEKHPAGSDENV